MFGSGSELEAEFKIKDKSIKTKVSNLRYNSSVNLMNRFVII